MEHLPSTSSRACVRFIVGRRWKHTYDKAGFSNFLNRHGLLDNNSGDLNINSGRMGLLEARTFLYSWMYVGTVHEILGDVLDDFVIDLSNGDTVVTTAYLNAHLKTWARKIASLPPSTALSELEGAESCLNQVFALLLKHHKSNYVSSNWALTADMTLSVGLLAEALDEERRSLSALYGPSTSGHRDRRLWEIALPETLDLGMLLDGWCPNHIKMCRTAFGLSATFYASLLSRPHQRVHNLCSEDECRAYEMPSRTYTTKHIQDSCICHHVEAPYNRLESMLRAGRIPLVCLDWTSESSSPSIKLFEWKPGRNFIAISHVWSHGLGNAETNSLPVCQLLKIESLVAKTSKSRVRQFFWIDTLSVAREPQALRRLAIEDIRRVYELADKVLVLDEELLASQISGSTHEETLMRINLSGWMRRLWTLHEQVRSNEIHFQFADGTYAANRFLEHFDNEARACQGHENLAFRNVVAARAIGIFRHVSCLKLEVDGPTRMARLWNLLRWRHLSWASDETVCMANMLGVSPETVKGLLAIPTGLRMPRFLDLFTVYPSALLFLQVPRLKRDGWRHLQEQASLGAWDTSVGIKTRHGLIVSCAHILLHSTDCSLFKNGRQFYLHPLVEQRT
ncbi:hypothetical protein QBC34DRAFT_450366 [Podospora aff. communis PSN243]|uniref:Heterokaryon incompatibility domain-containing protein n=1 Tax=Podospora aff. communis PSN243 TaxID=3040156 RepID=A0AAV9GIQ0_9PEZI|nr:hypothetical protein QBC34DRAFT_450366 [Podospora aff. communis PSN243]